MSNEKPPWRDIRAKGVFFFAFMSPHFRTTVRKFARLGKFDTVVSNFPLPLQIRSLPLPRAVLCPCREPISAPAASRTLPPVPPQSPGVKSLRHSFSAHLDVPGTGCRCRSLCPGAGCYLLGKVRGFAEKSLGLLNRLIADFEDCRDVVGRASRKRGSLPLFFRSPSPFRHLLQRPRRHDGTLPRSGLSGCAGRLGRLLR